MSSLTQAWKANPAVRVAARTVVIALLGYIVAAYAKGITDWKSFAAGGIIAVCYAILGLLTPLEPKVGPVKAEVSG